MVSALVYSSFSNKIEREADAIPKKRGPKTDVLEALVKRVDGLEKQLRHEQDDKQPASPVEKQEPARSPNVQADSGPPTKRQRVEPSVLNDSTTLSASPRGYRRQNPPSAFDGAY